MKEKELQQGRKRLHLLRMHLQIADGTRRRPGEREVRRLVFR
jgi:hypothetical protein